MIGRIVLACVVAVAVGIVLVGLLGPLLVSMHVPVAITVGDFLVTYGWVIAILAFFWFLFSGSGATWFHRTPPQ